MTLPDPGSNAPPPQPSPTGGEGARIKPSPLVGEGWGGGSAAAPIEDIVIVLGPLRDEPESRSKTLTIVIARRRGEAAADDGARLLRDAGRRAGGRPVGARGRAGAMPAGLVVGDAEPEEQAHVSVVSRPDPGVAPG